MTPDITSPANPKIKWLRNLHNNSTRKKEGVFLVEGAKEIAMALDGGYQPQAMFICLEIFGETLPAHDHASITTISKDCFEKVAYRTGSDGLLAVFEAKNKTVDELSFGSNPFFIVLESVEKPGNLGAVIRTADGAGADGVIVCSSSADIFNPNVIRASVGTVFTTQVTVGSNEEVYDFLEKHEINAYGAALTKEATLYSEQDFKSSVALVLGTEDKGLTNFWLDRSTPIIIPMHGSNDSLNVSNAAAILAYEVVRQRSL